MTIQSVEAYVKAVSWLKEKEDSHPFRCHTDVDYPSPPKVQERLQLNFIACRVGKEREWGFASEADMATFKRHYVTVDNRT